MSGRKTLLLLTGAALVVALFPAGSAAEEEGVPAKTDAHLAGGLVEVKDLALGRSVDAAVARAAEMGIPTSGDAVTVQVAALSGSAADAAAAIEAAGGTVEATYGEYAAGLVSVTELDDLAAADGIRTVGTPAVPFPEETVGEGPAYMDATAWHDKGFTGRGEVVAIIDSGFTGLPAATASGDVPAAGDIADPGAQVLKKNLCGVAGLNGSTIHGTAVAEVVHETAPDADLLLICIDSSADFSAALTFAQANGAKIASVSLGFFNTGRGDGTGSLETFADEARAKGILWINSSGNYAERHWKGNYADANSDRWHDTVWSTTVSGTANFYLKWDEWDPLSSCDLDLWVCLTSDCSGGSDPIASSLDYQTGPGGNPPVEQTSLSGSGTVYILVRNGDNVMADCNGNPRIDLFVPSGVNSISPAVAQSSVTGLVPNPQTHSVGAVSWVNGLIHSYSSRGPTIDGRTVPDITTPSCVSNATYGTFCGTSASAPGASGIAALLRQAWPGMTPAQLDTRLRLYTRDAGVAGDDSVYGAGIVDLPNPPVLGTCFGLAPTQTGSNGNDILIGGPGQDVIIGRNGNDTIQGMNGNDKLCGDNGNDTIYGGIGQDQIAGGFGADRLYGGDYSDRLYGGGHGDYLFGQGGPDFLYGQGGVDRMWGGPGDDLLNGGPLPDFGNGGTQTDTCYTENKVDCELPV